MKYIFKYLKTLVFHIFYGKVREVISVKKNANIKTTKIILQKKFSYNIFEIKNAILYNGQINDCAIISEKKLINEASYQYRLKNKFYVINGPSSKNIVLKIGTPSVRKNIPGSILSTLSGGAGKHNYFHWLFDVLPRLAILENAKNIASPDYYLMPSLQHAYQRETLKKLNISFSKLLDGKKNKHISCNKLFVINHPYVLNNNPTKSILNIPSWIVKWLQIKLKPLKQSKKKYPHNIFIDRSDSSSTKTRYIVNDNDVKSTLISIGFKIIVLSNLTFEEQVRTFQNARIVVGLHGAGFANIIFSRVGTKIIELQSPDAGDLYKNLAKTCKLNYKKISVQSEDQKLIHQHGNIFIDTKRLKKIIFSK